MLPAVAGGEEEAPPPVGAGAPVVAVELYGVEPLQNDGASLERIGRRPQESSSTPARCSIRPSLTPRSPSSHGPGLSMCFLAVCVYVAVFPRLGTPPAI